MTDQETALTLREREEMLHALGLEPTYWGTHKRWAYRNRYCLHPSGEDPTYQRWSSLLNRGMAGRNVSQQEGLTEMVFFHVTVKGLDALGPDIKKRVPKEWRFEK